MHLPTVVDTQPAEGPDVEGIMSLGLFAIDAILLIWFAFSGSDHPHAGLFVGAWIALAFMGGALSAFGIVRGGHTRLSKLSAGLHGLGLLVLLGLVLL